MKEGKVTKGRNRQQQSCVISPALSTSTLLFGLAGWGYFDNVKNPFIHTLHHVRRFGSNSWRLSYFQVQTAAYFLMTKVPLSHHKPSGIFARL